MPAQTWTTQRRTYNGPWRWSSSGTRKKPPQIWSKHSVSFQEAATVFGDPPGRIVADLRHSAEEERFVLLGLSQARRLIAVMYVNRGAAIRLISARPATRHERKNYEENTPREQGS